MKKKEKKKKLTAEQITAQEFTNVLNIQNNSLYTRDGYVIGYIKILPVSVGLLSQREKETLVKQLTAELSVEKEPFHFLAISRPVDMQPLLESYAHLRNETSDPYRRELLRKEMENLSDFTFGDEIVERQFFFYFSMKAAESRKVPSGGYAAEDVERDLKKRISEFAEHFEAVGIKTEILKDQDIVRLCNLVNNPAVVSIEDEMTDASIPILKGVI